MKELSKYFKGDPIIWLIIGLLSTISILVVYSSTASLAYKYHGGNTLYYFIRHGIFLLVGIFSAYIVHKIPYRMYFGLAAFLLGVAVVLMLLTWGIGSTKNSATRWITIPGLGIDFQTSDFAKFALVVFVAKILSMNQKDDFHLQKAFIIIIISLAGLGMLVVPADLSTGIIMFSTIFMMMVIGRIDKKYLIATVGAGIIAVLLFLAVASFFDADTRVGTWKSRVTSYFDPDSEMSFQATQSKIAIATSSIIGKGPGKSTQITSLPHPYSDFVYAIIIEEYGAILGVGVLLLYLILIFRVARIVNRQTRSFPAFLAIGLMLMIVIQAFMHMGVNVGIFPVTGQPLPLVSMGGTSSMFMGASLGVILNISRNRKNQSKAEKEKEQKYVVKDYPFIMG